MTFIVSAAIAVIIIVVAWSFSEDTPSKDKWPPISEDEFVRRCSPGVNRERALKVRRIIADQSGVDYDRIYPEQRFVEDLGWD